MFVYFSLATNFVQEEFEDSYFPHLIVHDARRIMIVFPSLHKMNMFKIPVVRNSGIALTFPLGFTEGTRKCKYQLVIPLVHV